MCRRKKRPRQDKQGSHRQISSSFSFWSTALALALLGSTASAQTYAQCTTDLAISDANRDYKLSQAEYVTYINHMSNSYYGNVQFAQLPIELTTNFVYWAGNDGLMEIDGSYPGTNPTPIQQQRLEDICYDTRTILYEITTPAPTISNNGVPSIAPLDVDQPTMAQPIDVPFETCRSHMALSDLSRDIQLDTQEYLRFIAHMSDQQLIFTEYAELPELLRFNFVLLSDVNPLTTNRFIDITGSSPGDNLDDIGAQQVEFLEKICHQTQNAINTLHLFGLPTATRPTPAGSAPVAPEPSPTSVTAPAFPPLFIPIKTTRPLPPISRPPLPFIPAPTQLTPTARPTNSYSQCRLAITASDRSRNDRVDELEYTELVHRLSGEDPLYRWETFETMPVNLRDTFNALAAQGQTIGQIDVYGAAPRQNPTEEERLFLEIVCADTEQAIALVPTPGPVSFPTNSPTEDFSDCRRDLAFSDTSPRNNFLGRTEYVAFVNRLSRGDYFQQTFYTLPPSLRDNFDTLASVERQNPEENGNGEAIYIYGSSPAQNADPVQVEFLRRVCEDTEAALEAASTPTVPTTPAPILTPAPTATAPVLVTPVTPAPTPSQTLRPNPQPVATPSPTNPQTTPRPTFPRATPQPTFPRTPRPTPLFGTLAPTLDPNPVVPDEEEGGVNTGALVGGFVAAIFVLICCVAVGKYLYTSTQKSGGDQMSEEDRDEEKGSEEESEDYGGFSAAPPSPGKADVGMFGNIGVALSPRPGSDDEEVSVEEDEEMGASKQSKLSKDYGEFGGPNLPIDFGDLENVSTSGSSSSGSEEERPSDRASNADTYDDDEESEKDLDNDAFFSGGGFGGDGGDGWGTGDDQDEESESGSGSEYSDEDENEEGQSYGESEYSGSGSEEEGSEGGSEYEGEEDDDEITLDEEDDFTREEGSQEGSSSQEGDEEEGDDDGNQREDSPSGFGDTFGADGFGFEQDGGFGESQDNDFFANKTGGSPQDDGFGTGNDIDFFDSPEKGDDGDESYRSSSEEDDEDIEQVSNRMDAQIDSGDWEGVAESIRSFDHDADMSGSGDIDKQSGETSEDDESDDDDDDDDSNSPDAVAQRAAYRSRVEELVNKVIPDEKGNIDDMLEQFKGREEDLINTLTTMEERTAQQPVPTPPGSESFSESYSNRDSGSYSGSTPSVEGLSPAKGRGPGMEGDEESFIPSIAEGEEGEEEESQFGESQSQYSEPMTELSEEERDDFSQGESQYSGEEGESQYSGEEGESQYSGEEGESQYSGEEGESQYSGEEGESQFSGEEGGSQGSYYSGEGDEEGSQGSYHSGDEQSGSYSGSQSQYSGEGSRSQYSGEGESQYSGSQGSYYSGDGGSQEGESRHSRSQGSYYSGDDQDRSYVDGEGSYYSGSYSGGSGSYED